MLAWLRKAVTAAVVVGALCACTGHHRLEAVQRLSDDQKALFSKYRQFMTEGQQDAFLALGTDEERQRYVADLRVEERLSRYPDYIQKAIWAQDVVVGMDKSAVLLSWSTPSLREWDEQELARGNEVERWSYEREGGWVQLTLANGIVTAVQRPESGQ